MMKDIGRNIDIELRKSLKKWLEDQGISATVIGVKGISLSIETENWYGWIDLSTKLYIRDKPTKPIETIKKYKTK